MMNKLKSKLHISTKPKSADGRSNELKESSEYKKFYLQFPKALGSVLHPGRHVVPTPSKKGTQRTAIYEEKNLVTYIEKHNQNLTGNFHDALEDMAFTYKQITDLKSERDLKIETDLFEPIKGGILKELSEISKLKKAVSDAEADLNSARKAAEKNAQDAQASEKLHRATGTLERAKDHLGRALTAFKEDEPKRIAMLSEAAQIQQDFYKKAADSFAQLVSNLNTIRERATNDVQNSSLYQNGISGGGTTTAILGSNAGYTNTIKESVNPPAVGFEGNRCRALYDFQAEADDDLSLKKDDIATILEKVDDQWYYGEKNGKRGHFPVEFVEKI